MRAFDGPKTIESVELSSISWFLAIQKNYEKSMAKWLPKSIKIEQNPNQNRPRDDRFSDLWSFGRT
jgi:hypothetical protein